MFYKAQLTPQQHSPEAPSPEGAFTEGELSPQIQPTL